MKKNKWYPWQNQNIINGAVEFLFISKGNEICTVTIKDYDLEKIKELGTILAVRILVAETKPTTPVQSAKKYVFYWNWQTRKVWPIHLKNPPNAKLSYLKVELYDESPPRAVYSVLSNKT